MKKRAAFVVNVEEEGPAAEQHLLSKQDVQPPAHICGGTEHSAEGLRIHHCWQKHATEAISASLWESDRQKCINPSADHWRRERVRAAPTFMLALKTDFQRRFYSLMETPAENKSSTFWRWTPQELGLCFSNAFFNQKVKGGRPGKVWRTVGQSGEGGQTFRFVGHKEGPDREQMNGGGLVTHLIREHMFCFWFYIYIYRYIYRV